MARIAGINIPVNKHVVIGLNCGMTEGEMEMVKAGPDAAWSAADRLLLVAADELHHDSTLSDATWAGLTELYTTEQVLDVIATVGNYHFVSMLLNATQVQLDPGVPDAF